MQPAKRLSNLPPYLFARLGQRIAELRAQGIDVIRLDIGSPDMPPDDEIIEALARSAHRPDGHGYAGYYGLPELRQAIADYYARRFGVDLDPEGEVLPLIGSKEGLANLSLAFLDPGDVALVPDPAYPTYELGAYLAGGTTHRFPLLAKQDFLPNLAAIPVGMARRAKLLWLSYPNNPTGAVASLEFFAEAVTFARERDLLLCHDNPYCEVAYEGYRPPSLLQVEGAKEVAIEFNSFSKTYNMAGWRIGMVVGNRAAIKALAQVKTNVDSGIFTAIQAAAVVALTGDQTWLESRNAIYQERRDIILEGLAAVGIKARKPLATLYIWAEVPQGYRSAEFAEKLLTEQGVSFAPGSAYGECGEGYLRISVGMATPRVREAMERLKEFQF
ncbi:MAG: aminotransferase class I/II-fold pyridoxal phosphate-dependent enzyme [Anaerolineales bacterium]|nr:MAG: aminotransferase class I/II-fold pyridoxal phosphate-dependent enzyme [Anaerolineales bacterium]